MPTRLAHKLQELARMRGSRDIPETHSELAALINASPEEVTKAVALLREQGIIANQPRHHGIHLLKIGRAPLIVARRQRNASPGG